MFVVVRTGKRFHAFWSDIVRNNQKVVSFMSVPAPLRIILHRLARNVIHPLFLASSAAHVRLEASLAMGIWTSAVPHEIQILRENPCLSDSDWQGFLLIFESGQNFRTLAGLKIIFGRASCTKLARAQHTDRRGASVVLQCYCRNSLGPGISDFLILSDSLISNI